MKLIRKFFGNIFGYTGTTLLVIGLMIIYGIDRTDKALDKLYNLAQDLELD